MQKTDVTSPAEYLANVDPAKKALVQTLYNLVVANIQPGFEETINWGFITWQVPFSIFPDTYNKQPLMYCAIAEQKQHAGLYLVSAYQQEGGPQELIHGFAAAGIKLDMGKSCLRFNKFEAVPEAVLAREIARHSPESFIAEYKAVRSRLDAVKKERKNNG
jgi:hypothetical protein